MIEPNIVALDGCSCPNGFLLTLIKDVRSVDLAVVLRSNERVYMV